MRFDPHSRLVVGGIGAAVLAVVAVVASGSRPSGAPAPTPEPTPTPTPVSATAPTEQGCPEGWNGFVNPAMNYEFCRPASFLALDPSGTKLGRIERADLDLVRFASREAFPRPSGASLLEGIRQTNAILIEIRFVADDARGVCGFGDATIGGSPACPARIDTDGDVAADGPLTVILVELPMTFPGDLRIFVRATTTPQRADRDGALIERILATLHRRGSTVTY